MSTKKIPLEEIIKILNKIHNTEEFRKIHGFDHYDYSLITKENYKNVRTKVPIKCNIHEHVFYTMLAEHKKYGCRKCGTDKTKNKLRTTNENVDERLLKMGNKFRRLEEIINQFSKINFQCTNIKCNYIWKTKPSLILHQEGRCPECDKKKISDYKMRRLSNEEVDKRLKESDMYVKRIENVDGQTKIFFQCTKELKNGMICEYKWKTTPSSLLHSKSSCPKCAGLLKLTNEEVDKRVENLKIPVKRLGEVVNSKTKIEWQCEINPEHKWFSPPATIFGSHCYCPICNEFHGERTIRMILQESNLNFGRQHSFPDCKFKRRLRFDFVVFDEFGEVKLLIEYDGQQHFMLSNFIKNKIFSNEEAKNNFEYQIIRDNIKNEYCRKNNIKLLRIRYDEIKIAKNLILNML